MNECRLKLNGMTCDSCERLIRKAAEESGAEVREVNIKEGFVDVLSPPPALESFRQKLAEKGFTESNTEAEERGDPARVARFIGAVIAGEPGVWVETRLLNHALGALVILVLLGSTAYFSLLSGMPKSQEFIPILLLAAGASVITISSYQHIMHYRRSMTSMNGMMAGMTMGMITGFLVGAVIGATNGMFIGSVAGMATGIAAGFGIGRCCGVMGAMEGLMAGLMAGIMGAMTSVMMINDNLVAFLYLLFAVCTFILGGLSYLMYREAGAAPKPAAMPAFTDFAAKCVMFALMIGLIILFGPKGAITFP